MQVYILRLTVGYANMRSLACWYCLFLSLTSQARQAFSCPVNTPRLASRFYGDAATMPAWTDGRIGETTRELPDG